MKILLIISSLFFLWSSQAQQLTFEMCLDSAFANNPELLDAHLDTELSELDVSMARREFFPTINLGARHGYNWGQTIDPFTNQFATNQVQFDNIYLMGSLPIFNRNDRFLALKKSELILEKSQIQELLNARNIKIRIALAYLEVVLQQQKLDILNKNLELTKASLNQKELLVESEKESSLNLLSLKAELLDELNQIEMANLQLHLAKIDLKALSGMQLDTSGNFMLDIHGPETNSAANTNLENELIEVQTGISELEAKQIRYTILPNLTLHSSLGSGYSGNNNMLNSNGEMVTKPLGVQFKENFYQSISLSLTVPIFNKGQRNLNIKKQQINADKEQFVLQNQLNELERQKLEIEVRVQSLTNQIANLEQLKSIQEQEFQHYSDLFLAGKVNFLGYERSKNQLVTTQMQLLQVSIELKFYSYISELTN